MFNMAKMLVLCMLPSALADQDSHGDEVDIVTLLDSVADGQEQTSWPSRLIVGGRLKELT